MIPNLSKVTTPSSGAAHTKAADLCKNDSLRKSIITLHLAYKEGGPSLYCLQILHTSQALKELKTPTVEELTGRATWVND